MNITKVILPVAGRGLRLRPLTLGRPKALVELAGKPLLSYALEDAEQSGFREAYIVVSPYHRAHFRRYLRDIAPKFPRIKFKVLIQENAFGNGQAIARAAEFLKGEPFAIRYCDDVLFGARPALASLVRVFMRYKAPVLTLQRIPRSAIGSYGVVAVDKMLEPSVCSISRVIEKPKKKEARDLAGVRGLAVVGGYIFTQKLLEYLVEADRVVPSLPDALKINVAFSREFDRGGRILGWEFDGKRFDCGNIAGLEEAEKFLRTRQLI